MGITKKRFVEIMNRLKKLNDFEDQMYELINDNQDVINNDFMTGRDLFITNDDLIVDLLELLTHDEDHDISYFMYELDFGRGYSEGCITYGGENVSFATPEDLYDWLEKIHNIKKEENNEKSR